VRWTNLQPSGVRFLRTQYTKNIEIGPRLTELF